MIIWRQLADLGESGRKLKHLGTTVTYQNLLHEGTNEQVQYVEKFPPLSSVRICAL
jgi:hypothetical protein